MCPYVVELGGSADYARGVIGRALCILLRWHRYNSRWLCASEFHESDEFDVAIDACLSDKSNKATHLIIDTVKNKHVINAPTMFGNNNATVSSDREESDIYEEEAKHNLNVSLNIIVEEKDVDATMKESTTLKVNDDNKTEHFRSDNNNTACECQEYEQHEHQHWQGPCLCIEDAKESATTNLTTNTENDDLKLNKETSFKVISKDMCLTNNDGNNDDDDNHNNNNNEEHIASIAQQAAKLQNEDYYCKKEQNKLYNEQVKENEKEVTHQACINNGGTEEELCAKQNTLCKLVEADYAKRFRDDKNNVKNDIHVCSTNTSQPTNINATILTAITKAASVNTSELQRTSATQSNAPSSKHVIKVEVIYDKRKQDNNMFTKDKGCGSGFSISGEVDACYYNVIHTSEPLPFSKTSSSSSSILHCNALSLQLREGNQEQNEEHHLTHKNKITKCKTIVDVVACIWKEMHKDKRCNAIIAYYIDRYERSKWSKETQNEYNKYIANYIDQMIKRAVKLSVEYHKILSQQNGEWHSTYSPLYTCIAFDINEYNKILKIVPPIMSQDKKTQQEFHMTTKFFGGAKNRIGCDDPLLFVMLNRFKGKNIEVELEAIVSDYKGVAVVVRNVKTSPYYDDYNWLYDVQEFNKHKLNISKSTIVSKVITEDAEEETNVSQIKKENISHSIEHKWHDEKESDNTNKTYSTECSEHEHQKICKLTTDNNNNSNSYIDDSNSHNDLDKNNNDNDNDYDYDYADEHMPTPFICANVTPHITIATRYGVPPVYSNTLCSNWWIKLEKIQKQLGRYYNQQRKAKKASAETGKYSSPSNRHRS